MNPLIWSSVAGFNGQLTWIPDGSGAVPADCVCGAALHITELSGDHTPIELTCGRGHRWRATIRLLEERLARHEEGKPSP